MSIFLAPVDLIAFRYKFARSSFNNIPQSLRDTYSVRQAYDEVMNKEGRNLLLGTTVVSTFIRYLFVLTASNTFLNYK